MSDIELKAREALDHLTNTALAAATEENQRAQIRADKEQILAFFGSNPRPPGH